jgi:hypothetical protein
MKRLWLRENDPLSCKVDSSIRYELAHQELCNLVPERIGSYLWQSKGFASSFSLCFCLNSSMFSLDVSLGFFTCSKF